jgi:hypothetical protein
MSSMRSRSCKTIASFDKQQLFFPESQFFNFSSLFFDFLELLLLTQLLVVKMVIPVLALVTLLVHLSLEAALFEIVGLGLGRRIVMVGGQRRLVRLEEGFTLALLFSSLI